MITSTPSLEPPQVQGAGRRLSALLTAVTVFLLIFGTLGLLTILGTAVALSELGLSTVVVSALDVGVAIAVGIPCFKFARAAWDYERNATD